MNKRKRLAPLFPLSSFLALREMALVRLDGQYGDAAVVAQVMRSSGIVLLIVLFVALMRWSVLSL